MKYFNKIKEAWQHEIITTASAGRACKQEALITIEDNDLGFGRNIPERGNNLKGKLKSRIIYHLGDNINNILQSNKKGGKQVFKKPKLILIFSLWRVVKTVLFRSFCFFEQTYRSVVFI